MTCPTHPHNALRTMPTPTRADCLCVGSLQPCATNAVLDVGHVELQHGAGKLFRASPALKAHVSSHLSAARTETGAGSAGEDLAADWAASVREHPPVTTAAHYCHASRTLYCSMTVLGNTHLLLSMSLPFSFDPPDQRTELTYSVGVVGWWSADEGETPSSAHFGASRSSARPRLSRTPSADGVEETKGSAPSPPPPARSPDPPATAGAVSTRAHPVALSASEAVVACVWRNHVRTWVVSDEGGTDAGEDHKADAANTEPDPGGAVVDISNVTTSSNVPWRPNVVVVDGVGDANKAVHSRVVITTPDGRVVSVPATRRATDTAVGGKAHPAAPYELWELADKQDSVTCLGVRGNVVLAGYATSRLVTADPRTGKPHPIVRAVKLRDLVRGVALYSCTPVGCLCPCSYLPNAAAPVTLCCLDTPWLTARCKKSLISARSRYVPVLYAGASALMPQQAFLHTICRTVRSNLQLSLCPRPSHGAPQRTCSSSRSRCSISAS